MWKALIAGTAAGVIAGSSLLFAQQQAPAPAAATPTGEQHDQDTGWQPSAEDDQDTGSAEDEQDNSWQPSAEDNQENSPPWRPSAEDVSALWTLASQRLRRDSGLPPIRRRTGPHLNQLFGIWPRHVRSGGQCVRTNSPPPTPSNGWSGVLTRSVKQRQVSKNSPMLKGHSIKVSMTRRNIVLRFSRRDYDRIATSPGGIGLAGTGDGVAIRTADGDTRRDFSPAQSEPERLVSFT